jgi:hypothetical protein
MDERFVLSDFPEIFSGLTSQIKHDAPRFQRKKRKKKRADTTGEETKTGYQRRYFCNSLRWN